jgi:L-iditol 2-dehydrogenase
MSSASELRRPGSHATMTVARFYEREDLRVEDALVPAAGPGELLVKVVACSVCGTDVKIFYHGHRLLEPPRVIGHEIAGVVVAAGDGVVGWSVGDRVQLIAAVPCGECRPCKAGLGNICDNLRSIGYHFDGGYAEYVVVPEIALRAGGVNRVPASLTLEAAALTEPLACVLNGQELARVGAGDDVVVIGAGPIGCMHVRLARARGAARVTLVELSQERLELAATRVQPDVVVKGGPEAVAAVQRETDGRGADVVIVAAASRIAQAQAVDMAAKRGRVSLFGSLPEDDRHLPLDSNAVHYRELQVVGAANSTPAQNTAALELIADGRVRVDDLITATLPLESVHEAIDAMRRGSGLKSVIAP